MLPTPKNYAIWPSVVPADKPCEMVIAPCEKAFLLFDGQEYTVTDIPVNADEANYYAPSCAIRLTATAKDGVLRFTHTFAEEQEHTVILEKDGVKIGECTVFSLYEDLYSLSPFKGDFHGHSFRSDGKRDPSALAGHYREFGYDFFSLTDHNRFYPGGEADETFSGVETGFLRIPGEEVHTPGSMVHIVHVGGDSGVTEKYVHESENYEQEIAACMEKVPADVPGQYRERYAKAMWATDNIHAAGGIAIFAHPYWRPTGSRIYNVRTDLAQLLLRSGMFDAFELVGGMGQSGNNLSVALWADLRAEGLNIPVVGSSDVHGLEKSATFPHLYTICFAKDATVSSIIESVKRGMSVAVETTGDEYARHYRCYGPLRLVTYAQFLLQHFFPQQQRICQGEGSAMRAYAMGDAPAALIELQARQTANFRSRFFGHSAPCLPDEGTIAFENKWREVHLKGPQTKGGRLTPPGSIQI